MAITTVIILAGVIGGLGAGYAFTAWRAGRSETGASQRDYIANTLFGGFLGFLIAAAAPLMAASIQAPDWREGVIPVTTADELNEILGQSADRPVLVYFYAAWCIPCRAMAPNIDTLAEEGRIVVAVDIDEAPRLAEMYNVRTLPTIYVFSNGNIHYSGHGYRSLSRLRGLMQ